MNSLKSLLPSFLLLIVYFIADEIFGPNVGILTAIALGAGEFIYTRIRKKTSDVMVLLTTLFFCIPGGIVLLTDSTAIKSLQPAIIETVLCIQLGVFVFLSPDPLASLPLEYRKTLNLNQAQQQAIRKNMRLLLYILAGHTLLSYLSLTLLDHRPASFICGPLSYIVLGSYLAVLFIRNRLTARKLRQEEWLPVVNREGEVTGKAPRSVCHSGSKLMHPVVHLHLLNDRQELFLQKRSMKKDLLPGKWDTAVGGHIALNEKVEEALKRETYEELGITQFEARFLHSYVWENPHECELVFSFLCTAHNEINIRNDEVEEGRYWTLRQIEQGIQCNVFTPNFVHEYKTLLEKIIKENV